ncbi:solute carrier family 36 member pathetic [Arctopsyche grandis]|uniref:solute carrier family 36 member pathetic n=1 Tax=Arctopsyche grandis TaxID=121162 RepID=UPI00406D6B0F
MPKETNGALPPPQELETFLPSDGSKRKGTITSEYKVNTDTEYGGFDPFAERKVDHPTTDCDTVTHLLKASLGTGILSMPLAFKSAGLVLGIFFTLLVALVCTHCCYILVKCAHYLYKKKKVTAMSFSEVSEVAFANGPKWGKKYAYSSKILILICLFLTYFLTCSVYTVIIAEHFNKVVIHLTGSEIDVRVMILFFLIPLILLSWIPNLKYLAPVSMIANIFMGLSLGTTIYYLVVNMKPETFKDLDSVGPINLWPDFFSLTIFAMEAIGVVMPLENSMKTPRHFLGICGVLNRGMSGVTLLYIALGFLGYLCHGDAVKPSIILNLPVEDIAVQIVLVLIGVAVYCTFGLQFYVCLEIGWNGIKDKFTKRPMLVNYIMRTVIVSAAVLLAIAVPTIAPFVSLIGAFCFCILGLIIPVLIEMITFWDVGFGRYNWIAWKNLIVLIFGVLALIFGTKKAIEDIIDVYVGDNSVASVSQVLNGTDVDPMRNVTEVVQNVTEYIQNVITNKTANSI